MARALVWGERAQAQPIALPPADAAQILLAMEAFAQRGVGFVRRMIPTNEQRLYTGSWFVAFVIIDDTIIAADIQPRRTK